MMALPGMPEDFKSKSFWERKEGLTGMIIGIPLIAALGYGLYKLLPYIITLLQNAITAIALGVVLVILVVVVTDKRFWNLLWNLYKSGMRKITQLFVEIDPIGILRNYVDSLKKNARDMNEQLGMLRGQIASLKNAIEKNERDKANALGLARQAQKSSNQMQMRVKARKAGRLEESNMTLDKLRIKMEILYRVLTKMYETCLSMIEDLEDEVNVKSKERESILASYSVYKSATRILNGDPDKKEMFDQAMEFLADDYGKKLGEIEHFMDMSRSVIEGVDLQKGVYEEQAMQMLADWEKKSDSLLLPAGEKARILDAAADPSDVLDISEFSAGAGAPRMPVTVVTGAPAPHAEAAAADSGYDDLFKRR